MKRSREELEASNNGGSSQNKITGSLDEEISLLIIIVISFEQRHDSNSTPSGKTKAMSFPISKITIGEWTREAVYEQDLKAKIYFARKKIMWECLHDEESRKIEMPWYDVLSLKPLYHLHDQTGILKVELRKPPTFWIETNPSQAGKATQWQQTDQDFTLNHSASRNRIHTLHFAPGILQRNMEKLLVSGDLFWSERVKVHFPTSEHLYFDDIGYGNSKNNMMATQLHSNQESSSNKD